VLPVKLAPYASKSRPSLTLSGFSPVEISASEAQEALLVTRLAG
jgi:hypothetical protein